MSETTEDWTEGLSEKDIEFYHKIESIGSGELKGYDELTSTTSRRPSSSATAPSSSRSSSRE